MFSSRGQTKARNQRHLLDTPGYRATTEGRAKWVAGERKQVGPGIPPRLREGALL
ncbi:MAG TPA: hypothetical protein VM095_08455 [Pyrinomonadaceae bacterium]|nr:hypothetical protein [Pyrinomonadaceae bacterium]